jgi:DNA-binding MarR family transcriptional regulator
MTVTNEFRSHDSINDPYLWGLLEHARSIVSRARELELSQHGITIEQMSILHALLINGGSANLDEIATTIIRQYNSVSTIVNRMSALGLVRKEKLKNEKKYKITITKKARIIVDTVPRESIQMMFSSFSVKDKEKMATYLERIIGTGRDILGLSFNPPFLKKKP